MHGRRWQTRVNADPCEDICQVYARSKPLLLSLSLSHDGGLSLLLPGLSRCGDIKAEYEGEGFRASISTLISVFTITVFVEGSLCARPAPKHLNCVISFKC